MTQELANRSQGSEPFKAEECKGISEYYEVPQELVNLFWVKLGGTAYPKVPFLIMQAQKKGVQRIEIELEEKDKTKQEWECKVSIYPKINRTEIEYLMSLKDDNERNRVWQYFTEPTVNYGRASLETVKMQSMQKYLPEMAVTRGIARTCRIYAGVGATSFEELPNSEISQEQIVDAKDRIAKARRVNEKPGQEVLG